MELNGQPIKTPGKRTLILPGCALAEAIAREWETQGDTVKLYVLLLTRLANSAADYVANQRELVVNEVVE